MRAMLDTGRAFVSQTEVVVVVLNNIPTLFGSFHVQYATLGIFVPGEPTFDNH